MEGSRDILSAAAILERMNTAWAGRTVIYDEVVDSTNHRAMCLDLDMGVHGTLVASGIQTAGKGRRGRVWESVSDTNIYMSLLLRPLTAPDKAPMLTLVMALSAAEAISEVAGADVGIKWPNDIVLNRKKVCGILTEMRAAKRRIERVVIGVGMNVNTPGFSPEIAAAATSLMLETGKTYLRVELIAAVMQRFEKNYEMFMQTEDLSLILKEYNYLLVNRGRDVRVLEPAQEYVGHALGIDEKGKLRVRKSGGSIAEISAGEVSVRGLYGYV